VAPSPVDGTQVFVCTSAFGAQHGATDRRVAPPARKLLILLKRNGADFLVAFGQRCLLTGRIMTGPKVMP
jgi:hypothetical protein